MAGITESMLEGTCLGWFQKLEWRRIYGPDIASDSPNNIGNDDWLALNELTVGRRSKPWSAPISGCVGATGCKKGSRH